MEAPPPGEELVLYGENRRLSGFHMVGGTGARADGQDEAGRKDEMRWEAGR